jgi:zinc transport system substrate-binding protein
MRVVNHSQDLDLLEGVCHDHDHSHGHAHNHGYDTHVWTSPAEVRKMVIAINKTLSELHPELKDRFNNNTNAFLVELDSLDNYIKHTLSETHTTKFFIFHPALNYFARDYGLTQIALEEEGKSPSMSHFKSVIQSAKDQGVSTIFIQREFDINTAKTAAKDLGGNVVVIDPLDREWLKNMYSITNYLKDALNGK